MFVKQHPQRVLFKENRNPTPLKSKFIRRGIHKDLIDFLIRAFVVAEAKNSGEPLNFLKKILNEGLFLKLFGEILVLDFPPICRILPTLVKVNGSLLSKDWYFESLSKVILNLSVEVIKTDMEEGTLICTGDRKLFSNIVIVHSLIPLPHCSTSNQYCQGKKDKLILFWMNLSQTRLLV